jgi:hypothetical protein
MTGLNGAAVSWANMVQPTVARSASEAQHIDSAAAALEGPWHAKLRL